MNAIGFAYISAGRTLCTLMLAIVRLNKRFKWSENFVGNSSVSNHM